MVKTTKPAFRTKLIRYKIIQSSRIISGLAGFCQRWFKTRFKL